MWQPCFKQIFNFTYSIRFKAASVKGSDVSGATSGTPARRRQPPQLPELPQLLLPRPDGDDENLEDDFITLNT